MFCGAKFTMPVSGNGRGVPTQVLDRNQSFDRLGDTELLKGDQESISKRLQIAEVPAA